MAGHTARRLHSPWLVGRLKSMAKTTPPHPYTGRTLPTRRTIQVDGIFILTQGFQPIILGQIGDLASCLQRWLMNMIPCLCILVMTVNLRLPHSRHSRKQWILMTGEGGLQVERLELSIRRSLDFDPIRSTKNFKWACPNCSWVWKIGSASNWKETMRGDRSHNLTSPVQNHFWEARYHMHRVAGENITVGHTTMYNQTVALAVTQHDRLADICVRTELHAKELSRKSLNQLCLFDAFFFGWVTGVSWLHL